MFTSCGKGPLTKKTREEKKLTCDIWHLTFRGKFILCCKKNGVLYFCFTKIKDRQLLLIFGFKKVNIIQKKKGAQLFF
jgi:hypothetical protein